MEYTGPKLNWNKKPEIFKEMVEIIKKESLTNQMIFNFTVVCNYVLKPDNGLIWSEVIKIIEGNV